MLLAVDRHKKLIDDFFSLRSGIGPKKPIHMGPTSATGHNSCPICGIQLSPEELESHFSAELGRLAKPNMYSERQEIRRTLSMELHAVQSSMQSRSSRWEVRTTRTLRLIDSICWQLNCYADISTNTSEPSRSVARQAAKTKIRGGSVRQHDMSELSRLSWTSAADAGRNRATYRRVRSKGKNIF